MSGSQSGDGTDDGTTQQQPGAGTNPYAFVLANPGMMQPGYGGYGGQAPIQDPMMIGPQRQMMWGQALLGQAADVSPVRSPWAAAARAVSGLLGGWESGQGQRQMIDITRQQLAASNANIADAQRIMSGIGTPGAQPGAPAPTAAPGTPPTPGKGPGMEAPATAQDLSALPDVQKLPPEMQGPFAAAVTKAGLGPNAAAQYARMIMVESGGQHLGASNNQLLRSSAGALGVAQVMPATFQDMKNKYAIQGDITDPAANLEAGARYFGQGLTAANGDLAGGAAYYNAGPGGLQTYQSGGQLPDETQKYLKSTGASAPTITAAPNVTVDQSGNAVIGQGSGFQAAMALREKALQMAGSPNQFDRARAPMLMQQAQALMNVGAWTTKVMPNGQIANINTITQQVQVTGQARQLIKDSADNLVDNQGNIVVPHGQYTGGQAFGPGGGQRLYFDPSGKPIVIGDQARVEQASRQDIASLGQKWLQGGAGGLNDSDKAMLDTAITNQFKPKTDKTGAVTWDVPPPQWIKDYYAGRGAGTPGAAAPTGTTTAPARTPAEAEAAITRAGADYDADSKMATDFATSSQAGDATLGITQNIRNLLASGNVKPGFFAPVQSEIGRIMSGAGFNPDTVKNTVGIDPSTAEELNKFLFQLQTAKQREMGAREPGSVLQMFMANYPNWQSRPETIEALTRALDMQTFYDKDRAQAMVDWTQTHRGDITNYQRIGTSAFNTWFRSQHDPAEYQAAALAASPSKVTVDAQGNRVLTPMPYSEWANGLKSKDAVQRALALVGQAYPSTTVMVGNTPHQFGTQ